MKNKLKGLYGITSQEILLDNDSLFEHVEHTLKGGMSILQYRNKQPERLQSIDDLIQLKDLCHDYNALFIINDDITLCAEVNADGVHLGEEDGNLQHARDLLGRDAIIGISCYNQISLAEQAAHEGASYIAFGAFYASPTKPNAATASLDLIKQAQSLDIPICCIGGISYANAKPLIEEGADMIAVISELFNFGSSQLNAEKFVHLF